MLPLAPQNPLLLLTTLPVTGPAPLFSLGKCRKDVPMTRDSRTRSHSQWIQVGPFRAEMRRNFFTKRADRMAYSCSYLPCFYAQDEGLHVRFYCQHQTMPELRGSTLKGGMWLALEFLQQYHHTNPFPSRSGNSRFNLVWSLLPISNSAGTIS
eukprot:g31615.t1